MRHRPRIDAPKVSEADIQKTCTALLELDGWRALRTDPVSRREWGKGFGELGMADHIYIRYLYGPGGGDACMCGMREGCVCAQVMWIEWKRRGGKAKAHQQDWHAHERARGALTLIAGEDFPASIEGFHAWYRQSGLMRREIALTAKLMNAYVPKPDPLERLGEIAQESIAKAPR